jgi:hypothetical protein
MKDRLISLVVFCALGLGACFASYKFGPIPVTMLKQSKSAEAPPGWVPPPAAPVVPPVAPPPAPKQPVQPTPRQQG